MELNYWGLRIVSEETNFGGYLKQVREKKGYSINKLNQRSGVSAAHISRIESGKRSTPSPETIEKLSKALGTNYEEMMKVAGYLHDRVKEDSGVYVISEAISEDPELATFWDELVKRDDLQIMLKQVKDLSPNAIRRIIKYIKMVEDEESQES